MHYPQGTDGHRNGPPRHVEESAGPQVDNLQGVHGKSIEREAKEVMGRLGHSYWTMTAESRVSDLKPGLRCKSIQNPAQDSEE
jgi:hypothetical protein